MRNGSVEDCRRKYMWLRVAARKIRLGSFFLSPVTYWPHVRSHEDSVTPYERKKGAPSPLLPRLVDNNLLSVIFIGVIVFAPSKHVMHNVTANIKASIKGFRYLDTFKNNGSLKWMTIHWIIELVTNSRSRESIYIKMFLPVRCDDSSSDIICFGANRVQNTLGFHDLPVRSN